MKCESYHQWRQKCENASMAAGSGGISYDIIGVMVSVMK
jgi:hypothetical protein